MAKVARYAVLGALFLILLTPLYVAGDSFFPYITGKNFVFRILVEVAVAGWIVMALADKQYRPRWSWALLIFSALTAWMFVANLFGVEPHSAFWSNYERMDGWVMLIHVFGFFLVASSVLTAEKLWRKWWLTFLSVSFVVCLYGLGQILCDGQACGAPGAFFEIHQGGVRLDGTFGNAIYLAVYLMFGVFIALWQAIESKGQLRQALIALAVFQSIILLFTATRGATLALFGGLSLAAVLWAVHAGGKTRKAAITALVAVVIVIGGFILLKDTPMIQESPIFSRIASISLSELSTRFKVWNMAYQGFLEQPVTGWGQEGFNYVFNTHYDPSLFNVEPYYDRVHNAYLDWLIAGGLPALLLFLALLLSAAYALYRRTSSQPERILLLSALAAYAVQAIVVFDNLWSYIPLAAILAVAHVSSARDWRLMDRLPVVKEQVAAPVALVVAAGIVWIVNVPGMLAARDLIQASLTRQDSPTSNIAHLDKALSRGSFAQQEIAERAVDYASAFGRNPSAPDAAKLQLATYAVGLIDAQAARTPGDTRILMYQAIAHRNIGDTAGAIALLERARELSPTKQHVYLELGSTKWLANDQHGAIEAFTAASELDPSFDEPFLHIVSAQILRGDIAAARQNLMDRFGTTTVDSNILWNAYVQAERAEELIALQELRVRKSNGAPQDRLMLARVYAVAGYTAKARAEIEATIAAHPEVAAEGAALLQQLP